MASITEDDVAETIGLEITAELKRRGITKDDAEKIAVGVTQKLRWLYGGHNVYFQKNRIQNINQRDAEIYAAFKGNNYADLAFQYGLTEMRIRQIIEKVTFCHRGKHSRHLLVRESGTNHQ